MPPVQVRRYDCRFSDAHALRVPVMRRSEPTGAKTMLAAAKQTPSFHVDGSKAPPGWIFVFGSNLAGRHGAGAAKAARLDFGAVYGHGVGRTGNAYGIPTKDGRGGGSLQDRRESLTIEVIRIHIEDFIAYARANPDLRFFVTRIGCGLAGHRDDVIGPMFAAAPANCSLPSDWKPYACTQSVQPLDDLNEEEHSC